MPRVCELYPGICLTTEEKARKNLSQGSRRVPVGTMKTECTEQKIQGIFLFCQERLKADHVLTLSVAAGSSKRIPLNARSGFTSYYPFGAGIIFFILAHPVYKM